MSAQPNDRQTQIRLRALSAGLRQGRVCILHQDTEHRFNLAENIPEDWSQQDVRGLREADILPSEIAADLARAHDRCRIGDAPQIVQFTLGEGLSRRDFEARLTPDEDGVLIIVTDLTDEHSREKAVASLLREVSHRSKNLLAIVQSVAMQTAQHTDSVEDFLSRFRGRLHALSSTQDLVTESDWRGTYLQSLIISQLTRVGSAALGHVHITGDNPLLGPNASLHVGLAIHELGVNAALHGALATETAGHVRIDVRIVRQPGMLPDLVIEWQETGIDATRRRQARFGTLVLERIVPLSIGGSAEFQIEADSVRYRLVVPADQFEA